MVGGGPAFLVQLIFDAERLARAGDDRVRGRQRARGEDPATQIVQDEAEKELEAEELHQPSILLAGSAMAVIRIAVGVTVFLSAFSFKDDKIELAIVLGAYAVGGFVGNLVAPIARRQVREEVILVTCLLGRRRSCCSAR